MHVFKILDRYTKRSGSAKGKAKWQREGHSRRADPNVETEAGDTRARNLESSRHFSTTAFDLAVVVV